MRKELDLDLTDRITVIWQSDDPLIGETVERHGEYIRNETLCDALTSGEPDGGKEIKLGDRTVVLAVAKSS